MSNERLLKLIDKNADWLISLYYFFEKLGIGRFINRFLQICDIKNTMPSGLSKEKLREWVMLDTFDMFFPRHDSHKKLRLLKNGLRNLI